MDGVLVLGGSGMLGSMVTDCLARDSQLRVSATVRSNSLLDRCCAKLPMVEWRLFDADVHDENGIQRVLGDAKWIINAIGLTKPYTHDDNPAEIERAVRINALFPHELAHVAAEKGARVLQIATDCVYAGTRGHYVESDQHDALDVYGKTKSLGEVFLPNFHCLRCSIVGPEPKAHIFLLDWFCTQPLNAQVSGYTNHQWNGVTTLHFARLCRGIIGHDIELPHVQHVIPSGTVSKADLLQYFARSYRRKGITVIPTQARTVIDRTLATENDSLNRRLWKAGGYSRPPSVSQMVDELAQFEYQLRDL